MVSGRHYAGLRSEDKPGPTDKLFRDLPVLRLVRIENQQGDETEYRSPQGPAKHGSIVVGQLFPRDFTLVGNERGELTA